MNRSTHLDLPLPTVSGLEAIRERAKQYALPWKRFPAAREAFITNGRGDIETLLGEVDRLQRMVRRLALDEMRRIAVEHDLYDATSDGGTSDVDDESLDEYRGRILKDAEEHHKIVKLTGSRSVSDPTPSNDRCDWCGSRVRRPAARM